MNAKTTFVTIKRKKIPLFPFQERLAKEIAKKLIKGDRNIGIEVGLGRQIIMQRVADLLDHKNVKYLYERPN